jgi:hypothetical protein
MDVDDAAANFKRAMRHCDNLVTVHRGHGGGAPGKRDKEVSINRAVIVLAVASWQAVVQDFTLACVDLSAPAPGGPLSVASYALLAGRVKKEVNDFATPNAQNTRRLMVGAGFDPRPHWTWSQMGGQGVGTITRSPADADQRIDDWLKVRHAIAHGHATLPLVDALQAVRGVTPVPADPQLRLVDAEQCLAFFRRLAQLTGSALAKHLGVPAPSWA